MTWLSLGESFLSVEMGRVAVCVALERSSEEEASIITGTS